MHSRRNFLRTLTVGAAAVPVAALGAGEIFRASREPVGGSDASAIIGDSSVKFVHVADLLRPICAMTTFRGELIVATEGNYIYALSLNERY